MVTRPLSAPIVAALKRISANDLQCLAEDMACVKFPDRFNAGTLMRRGRNIDAQTTKNWPDACVSTGAGEVDGIEATRQGNWDKHLADDLKKAQDGKNDRLSGYFFVGGMPSSTPTAKDIPGWTDKFAALGIPRERISLLVGLDLVAELEKPEYAGVRHRRLAIPPGFSTFQLLGASAIFDRRLGSFEPNADEYAAGRVGAPAALTDVEAALAADGVALVRGIGAAGKTTLARLLALTSDRAPKTTFYTDLAQQPAGHGQQMLNELTELAGAGVLVIVDNIHLDETLAAQVEQHWRSACKPLGSQLLLLGRRTELTNDSPLASLPPIELRASFTEMRAVVNRLAQRRTDAPPQVTDAVAAKWARTFGGSALPDETAVDLIAFTAAVEERLPALLTGDMRLASADATKGVRARYLGPLAGEAELPNLLRLAALSEFEIEASDALLPAPLAGFPRTVDELGIVLRGEGGSTGRQSYRLIHAALGDILIGATPGFDRSAELCAIAAQNPAAGLRILAGLKRIRAAPARVQPVEAAVAGAFADHRLAASAATFTELRVLARHVFTNGFKTAAALDTEIADSARLGELLASVRTLSPLNNFTSWAPKLGLTKTYAIITAHALDRASAVHDTLYHSTILDVCNLARSLKSGEQFLKQIDRARWAKAQAQSPPLPIGEVVAAMGFLTRSGHGDLAVPPARHQLMLAGERPIFACDISHFSQLLRRSQCDDQDSAATFANLARAGWLDLMYEENAIGELAGALLSFANHAGKATRATLLRASLGARVHAELRADRPPNEAAKYAGRAICLAGGFCALGGHIEAGTIVEPSPSEADWMLSGLQIKQPLALGMYQIQFWLGLKALHERGTGPASMPLDAGEEFLAKFEASRPPTDRAAQIQTTLCEWLAGRKQDGWLRAEV